MARSLSPVCDSTCARPKCAFTCFGSRSRAVCSSARACSTSFSRRQQEPARTCAGACSGSTSIAYLNWSSASECICWRMYSETQQHAGLNRFLVLVQEAQQLVASFVEALLSHQRDGVLQTLTADPLDAANARRPVLFRGHNALPILRIGGDAIRRALNGLGDFAF